MTRMGKVLLAVLVLMLTCSPAIGADKSDIKDKGTKWIKIKVNKDTGEILGLKKDTGEPGRFVKPPHAGTVVGTIIFHHSSPGCIDIVVGNYSWEVCY